MNRVGSLIPGIVGSGLKPLDTFSSLRIATVVRRIVGSPPNGSGCSQNRYKVFNSVTSAEDASRYQLVPPTHG